jgi:DNA-directed RNA polymerase specialized sigma24 family protein
MNCRSIPHETWEHVRRSLFFYFSRRRLRNDADDLTQETLYAVWNRHDYEFEKEEDFPRICHAFARLILKSRLRAQTRLPAAELDPSMAEPQADIAGMNSSEMAVYLDQVRQMGRSRLNDREWRLIEDAMEADGASAAASQDPRKGGNLRVYLHRARKKLARISGWRSADM